MCWDQCQPGEEDGEGRQGVYVSHLCGEGEASQGTEGDEQVKWVWFKRGVCLHFPSNRSARIGRRDVIKEKDMKKKLDGSGVGVARRRSSSGVAGTPEDADYGLSQLFQPDNAPKMEPGAEVAEDAMVRSKFKVHVCIRVCNIWSVMCVAFLCWCRWNTLGHVSIQTAPRPQPRPQCTAERRVWRDMLQTPSRCFLTGGSPSTPTPRTLSVGLGASV